MIERDRALAVHADFELANDAERARGRAAAIVDDAVAIVVFAVAARVGSVRREDGRILRGCVGRGRRIVAVRASVERRGARAVRIPGRHAVGPCASEYTITTNLDPNATEDPTSGADWLMMLATGEQENVGDFVIEAEAE